MKRLSTENYSEKGYTEQEHIEQVKACLSRFLETKSGEEELRENIVRLENTRKQLGGDEGPLTEYLKKKNDEYAGLKRHREELFVETDCLIDTLPWAEERKLLKMVFLEGKDVKSIAEKSDCTEKTVLRRINKGCGSIILPEDEVCRAVQISAGCMTGSVCGCP